MNKEQRLDFIAKEADAITNELEPIIQQIMLLNSFIKDVSKVAKGDEASYKLTEIIKKNK